MIQSSFVHPMIPELLTGVALVKCELVSQYMLVQQCMPSVYTMEVGLFGCWLCAINHSMNGVLTLVSMYTFSLYWQTKCVGFGVRARNIGSV